MAFTSLGGLVNSSASRMGVRSQVTIALALERAELAIKMLLGEEIAEHVKPLYVRHKTLNIASLSPAAATYIGSVQDDILAYVNQGVAKPIAERIRVIS